jgi:peptide-methionine (S)-S-oxide reductase
MSKIILAVLALATADGKQKAVFAGGCFWCTEAVFERVVGVENVVSGYAGGKPDQAKYDLVSAGRTDHAECVEITFDPAKITYEQLLKIFFSVAHDPTQLNRQGPDYGRQYRSAVFYANAEQKRAVEAYVKQLGESKTFSKPIVTQIVPLQGFYPAEAYHQDFVKRNPNHPYVVVNALPKVQKLKKTYLELVR